MEKRICPLCGASVIDDFWEEIDIQENGNMVVDAFEAIICENMCGYNERKTFK